MKCKIKWVNAGLLIVLTVISISLMGVTSAWAHWWDKHGEPQYGGSLTIRTNALNQNFDNYSFFDGQWQFWFEHLWMQDWTLDRNTWAFQTMFTPAEYYTGLLAESWEQPDAQTVIVHIHKGVTWQNKPPVNGREFTAEDIEFHYDRMLGTGHGYTQPSPFYAGMAANWERVRALDKYTVEIKFKTPTALAMLSVVDQFALNTYEPPEWVALGGSPSSGPAPGPMKGGPEKGGPEKGGAEKGGQPKGGPPAMASGGPLQDWKNAVGTGAWILTNSVQSTSMTYSKNPDYWGYDQRFPKNRVPYLDQLKLLSIPDDATTIAALRTGKIDILNDVGWQQAATLAKSNPDIIQAQVPAGTAAVDLRCDTKPFTDIRVRKALQLSIDRKTIAKTYYNGIVDGTPCGLVNPALKGYSYTYEEWPQELKDEYTYNPEKAKKMLADAGFPNGFKTNIVAPNNRDLQLLQVIQDYFRAIGVEMDINSMDMPTFVNLTEAGKFDQMSYQAMGYTQPPNVIITMRSSKPGMMPNCTYNNSPEYDAIVNEFYTTHDTGAIKPLMVKADKLTIEQHWSVNTFPIVTYNVWQPYIKGYSGEGLFWGSGPIYARLWVDQKMKGKK